MDKGLLVSENLYDIDNTQVVHRLDQALRANIMYKRDDNYIVKDQVIIIDEFTGRMMEGRRWSNGLHQASKQKGQRSGKLNNGFDNVQNNTRMYPKLSG